MEIRDVRLLLGQLNRMEVGENAELTVKLEEAKKKVLTYIAETFSPTVKFEKLEEK